MKKALIIILLLAACKSRPESTIVIQIDKAQGVVNILGVAAPTLNGIKKDTLIMAAWQSLLPVCKMPADTDMRNYQSPLQGKYAIAGDKITFKPDTAFKRGQVYFARYYRYDEQVTGMDIVTHRRTLGKASYTELIFKY